MVDRRHNGGREWRRRHSNRRISTDWTRPQRRRSGPWPFRDGLEESRRRMESGARYRLDNVAGRLCPKEVVSSNVTVLKVARTIVDPLLELVRSGIAGAVIVAAVRSAVRSAVPVRAQAV